MRRDILNYLSGFVSKGAFRIILALPVSYTLLIILFMLLIFPLISSENSQSGDFNSSRNYTLMAVTLVSIIPFLTGCLFALLHQEEAFVGGTDHFSSGNTANKKIIFSGIAVCVIMTFLLNLPVIYITDPVSSEGWLRSLFIAFLLATLAPLIFFLTAILFRERLSKIKALFIMLLLTMTLPVGLLLHRPWSYLAFFSPFYWTGWAWIVPSPMESLLYGIIAGGLTLISIILLFRWITEKKTKITSSSGIS
jgi:hypothetical protein